MEALGIKPHGQALPVRAAGGAAEPGAVDAKAKAAAIEFEALLLGTVVNEMLNDSAPRTMNGGMGEEMFRGLLGQEIGRQIAESGGVGIAASVEQSIKAYSR